ncbi:MAG: prepilin-type N-terminal cleavage/methylation domain-containing protein [Armatimonadetes bacterium]|nr:prepilin-type N-terminal cleavage/methylation domain-containing protein [Armatimonadota bacterium]
MLRSQHGFTAVEVAVVSVILLALAATAFPIYSGYMDDAAVSQAKADCAIIANAVQMYHRDTNQWPPDQPLGKEVPELFAAPGPYLVNFPKGPKKMIRTEGADSGVYRYEKQTKGSNDRARVTCYGLNKTLQTVWDDYYVPEGKDDIIEFLNRVP